jgi:pyruvate ferredoxin oxidoreductase gamma subunit
VVIGLFALDRVRIRTVRRVPAGAIGGYPQSRKDLPRMTAAGRAGDHRHVFQVRIHGRGGQGVVTAAELLSIAAFEESRHAQAFPSFGSERNGAPVVAFCRIDDKEIRVREPIAEPDAVIVQDPTLLHQVDVFGGIGADAYVLINTARGLDDLGIGEVVARLRHDRLLTVPATDLARELLGRPIPNSALIGGFAALSGLVSLDAVAAAIREKFAGKVAEANVSVAERAYELVTDEARELADA